MTDNTSPRVRKVGGVRFTTDATDSLEKHGESPLTTNELPWEQCCENGSSFDLYFGILKLSHSYTMTMDVIFHRSPVKLEALLDHQHTDGLQLLVTELPHTTTHSENRTSYQVEVVISAKTISGPFHRTFSLQDISKAQQTPITVNVNGNILRQGQGTATLRHGVHMKSILTDEENDDEE